MSTEARSSVAEVIAAFETIPPCERERRGYIPLIKEIAPALMVALNRGWSIEKISARLREHGYEISAYTLRKHLREYRGASARGGARRRRRAGGSAQAPGDTLPFTPQLQEPGQSGGPALEPGSAPPQAPQPRENGETTNGARKSGDDDGSAETSAVQSAATTAGTATGAPQKHTGHAGRDRDTRTI